jgi:hypothetical protein
MNWTTRTDMDIDDLQYSDEYAEYIMNNASGDGRFVCNGDMLLDLMEDGYLFEQFLATIQ